MKLNQNRPRRYEMDMCSGPILSKVFRFSLPLMATSILQLLFNAADIAVVGQFAGSNALSAVGATGADVVGVHGTTVSRTVRNKYMRTPFGTMELRKFFTGGLATESGETVSNMSVQRQIRDLIAAEDATNPLSDDRIAAILKAKGITIARRTVAKYRIELGIPGAIERRLKS